MSISTWLSNLRSRVRPKPEPAHLALGRWGEKKAESYLRKETDLKILGRRVRVGKHDEIDLLARFNSILVVIEVKTRATEGLRPVRDAVGSKKQWRLNRAAVRYAKHLDPKPEGIRFDIVEVIGSPQQKELKIHHIPGAFGLHKSFRV